MVLVFRVTGSTLVVEEWISKITKDSNLISEPTRKIGISVYNEVKSIRGRDRLSRWVIQLYRRNNLFLYHEFSKDSSRTIPVPAGCLDPSRLNNLPTRLVPAAHR